MSVNDIHPAWFLGIIGNSVLGMIVLLLAFLCLIFQRKREKDGKNTKTYFFLISSLISLSLYAFSIVGIYYWIYTIQQDSCVNTIFITNGIWIFFDLFLISYMFAIIYLLKYNSKKLIGLIILLSICYISISIPLNSSCVYWNEGAVVVEFVREEIVLIHSYFSILFCLVGILLSFYRFIQERVIFTKGNENNKNTISVNKSFWVILSLLSLLITFTLPRVDEESFITPINVKIFGYLIYGLFLVFSYFAFIKPKFFKMKFLRLYLRLNEKDDYERYQNLILVELIIFVLIYVILQSSFPIIQQYVIHYPDSDSALKAKIAFFLFELGNIKWFVHIIGALIPGILALMLLIIFLIIQKNRKKTIMFITAIFILQSTISAIFNIPLKEKLSDGTSFHPITIGFYLAPLIVLSMIFILCVKNESCKIKEKWNSGKRKLPLFWRYYFSPIMVYIPTVFSAILTDFMQKNSPTGKILIGGDSFSDGIFYLPILVTLISIIFFYSLIFLYPKAIFLHEFKSVSKKQTS